MELTAATAAIAFFLCHIVGDYILQSDYVATNKTKDSEVCWFHAFMYMLPYAIVFDLSAWPMIFIAGTHFVIDRFRLARYVIILKNYINPPLDPHWAESAKTLEPVCPATGFNANRPEWLRFMLLFIVDNTMHLLCNFVAIAYLS